VRALVTAEFTDDGVRRLEALGLQVTRAGWGTTRRALDAAALVEAAAGVEVLVTELEVVDAGVLAALPALRLVATARGGPVNVDLAACAARDVPVVFTPARNADSVATSSRGPAVDEPRHRRAERHLRSQGWHVDGELPYLHFRGRELAGLVLGVVGYGAVGRRVASGARRLRHDGAVHRPRRGRRVPLDELLERCDVVSLHCPRSRDRRAARRAGAAPMRRGSVLINTAGGGMVDEAALVRALRDGHLSGAALDVFATEPLPRDSGLLGARTCCSPRTWPARLDVVRHHSDMVCDDVERWLRGEPLLHQASWSATS
jgi:phosphoglycerate dehydrogenase-like enzyme